MNNKKLAALLSAGIYSMLPLLSVEAAAEQAVQKVEKGAIVMEGMPALDEQLAKTVGRYAEIRHAALVDWMPDSQSLLIRTRFGEVNQLHEVAAPMGARKQLTFFTEPVSVTAIRPIKSQRHVAYLRDEAGAEDYQLFLFDLNDDIHIPITKNKSRVSSLLWSPSGRLLMYSSNERNGVDFDVYVYYPETKASKRVYEVIGSFSVLAISSDDKLAIVRQYISVNESRLVLLDIESGRVEPVRVLPGKVAYDQVQFSADNRFLYVIHSGKGEFKTLSKFELANGVLTSIAGSHQWDVEQFVLDPKTEVLIYRVNEEGRDRLYARNLKTQENMSLPELPIAVISNMSLSPDGSRLALSYSSATTAGDVFVSALYEPKWEAWTESEIAGLDRQRFVAPQLIRYPSFDQNKQGTRTIPAWMYKPASRAGEKIPVVIHIHGGPESQARPSFNETAQFLTAELGVAMIMPNVRGSSGYGESYVNLDNGFLREDAVKDIGALLDWVATQPDLDSERVLVWGGSYGGYMVLASMVHYSARLRGGIDVVGISHFSTFLKNTNAYRQDLRRVEYGDERDPDMRRFFDEIAPLNHADKIKVPLLVVQGLNDPRVPASEAEQIVRSLRKNQIPVWYMLAKDEGHGFSKKSNRQLYQTYAFSFIQQQLLGATP